MLVSAFAGYADDPRRLRARDPRALSLLQLRRRDAARTCSASAERATIAAMEFQVSARCGAARRGRLTLAHGVVETPVFMPVGTYGTVKAMSPAELDREQRADRSRQRLSSLAAARARGHCRARRPASLHGLAGADPHRLGRLPGLQPGPAAQGAGGWRRLRIAHQRRPAVPHAGDVDRDPAHARRRHRHGVRRMHAVAGDAGRGCALDATQPALGRPLEARAHRQRQRAVRHRPGRHVRRPARRIAGRAGRTSASTAMPSAACRSASPRKRCSASRTTSRRACPKTGRAT